MTRRGTRVGFEGSIHVPEDEICFFVFDAQSGREAALVAQQAGTAVRVDSGAYGKLCQLVPALLNILQDQVINVITAGDQLLANIRGSPITPSRSIRTSAA